MSLNGWNQGQKIKLTLSDPAETLTSFPLLVPISSSMGIGAYSGVDIFAKLSSNSKKIAFEYGDSGAQCSAELVYWDQNNNKAAFYVNVPTYQQGTIVNLYYDETHSDNTGYVGNIGSAVAQSVWNGNYVTVLHMAQDPSVGNITDSTGNSRHGVPSGNMTAGDLIDFGLIKGLDFDSDDKLSVNISSQLTTATIETYSSNSSPSQYESIFGPTSVVNNGLSLLVNAGGNGVDIQRRNSGLTTGISGLSLGSPQYVSVVVSSPNLTITNANGNTTSYTDKPSVIASSLYVGYADGMYHWGAGSSGKISEFRISSVARSSSWIESSRLSLLDQVYTATFSPVLSLDDKFLYIDENGKKRERSISAILDASPIQATFGNTGGETERTVAVGEFIDRVRLTVTGAYSSDTTGMLQLKHASDTQGIVTNIPMDTFGFVYNGTVLEKNNLPAAATVELVISQASATGTCNLMVTKIPG